MFVMKKFASQDALTRPKASRCGRASDLYSEAVFSCLLCRQELTCSRQAFCTSRRWNIYIPLQHLCIATNNGEPGSNRADFTLQESHPFTANHWQVSKQADNRANRWHSSGVGEFTYFWLKQSPRGGCALPFAIRE